MHIPSNLSNSYAAQGINPPARRRPRIVPVRAKDMRTSPAKRGRSASFKKADFVRAVAAAARAGINVASVEVAPNGSIRIYAAGQEPSKTLFDQWSDKL